MTTPNDDQLHRLLRGLPREMSPPQPVWDVLTRRIAAEPRAAQAGTCSAAPPASVTTRHRRRRRGLVAAGAALAAVLAVVAVVPILNRPPDTGSMRTVTEAQAEAIAAEYVVAIAAMPDARASDALRPALDELDRSVEAIHAAIVESPDAVFLIGQLRRAYDQRLELTRLASRDGAFNIASRTSP